MSTLLQIKTSLFSDAGASSRLTNQFANAWRVANPGGRLLVRDLAIDPVPHLDAERFGAFQSRIDQLSESQRAVLCYSDDLISELRAADVLVIGMPMYNFGVPSTFKSYIDHVARAGVTFRFTTTGPVGLLTGKKAYVFATRGGLYAGTPLDSQSSYLRLVLGFLGLDDVQFVFAEGLAKGDGQKERALADAGALACSLAQGEALVTSE